MDQGVILATDSRFTYGKTRYDDKGRKVYPLANDACGVFAGDVLSAQRALGDIHRYLARRPTPRRGDPVDVARWFLRRAHDREQARARDGKSRAAPGPLYVLVGSCSPGGEASVARFSSQSGFSPIHLLGVEAAGWPEDIAVFKRRLLEFEQQRWERGNDLSIDPAAWQGDVVMAMLSALEDPGRSRTIGGQIQSYTITKDGPSEHQIGWVGQTGNPMNEADWTRATVPLAEVQAAVRSRTAEAPDPELGIVHAHVLG